MKVLVTRRLPGPGLDRLRAAHEVTVWPGQLPPEPAELRALAADAHAVICTLNDRIDAELLDAAPHLRVVANCAVGVDNLDLPALASRGIEAGNTPDVLTDATADLTFALLLAAARRIPEATAYGRDGNWRTWEPALLLGRDLAGARLLIVGRGRIGTAVARRAAGFGLDARFAGRGDVLADLAPSADFLSLHCPLTTETHHLVGADVLGALPDDAVLVNTARGGLVDHDALTSALTAGRLWAALDVTEPEPLPADHPLWTIERCIVLPHLGSATSRTRARMTDIAVDNVLAGLRGEPLPHQAGS